MSWFRSRSTRPLAQPSAAGPIFGTSPGSATSKRRRISTCVSDALNVDLAPDGTVYGIELLNANEQLQASDNGTLVVINEALGERREIPLTR